MWSRFEHRTAPLLPAARFVRRVVAHFLAALLMMALALGIGVLGYRWTEQMTWLDALLNAAMILGGMGPVSPLASDAGKLFAAFYALFSGVVFLVVASIVVSPLAHRLLHRLHLEE